jgi:hypothetical protein
MTSILHLIVVSCLVFSIRYLLFNTAISGTWGFPSPCPQDCPCNCFDPRKDECLCALPHNMIDNFPASFLVDYVRVYQDKSDPDHIIGCSTKKYPTKTFIQVWFFHFFAFACLFLTSSLYLGSP